MALMSKGLLATLLVLSLAHLALSRYSDDDEVPTYKKVNVYAGKKFHKKRYISGYYDGKPSYDDDDDTEEEEYKNDGDDEVEAKKPIYKKNGTEVKKPLYKKPSKLYGVHGVKKPLYKKPSKSYPFSKPYHKYKPTYKPEPVYKSVHPFSKPYQKYKPYQQYKPEPTYKHKPALYYKPRPIYTKSDTQPVSYTKPETQPAYEKPLPEDKEPEEEEEPSPYKRPYHKRPPVPEYETPEKPEPMNVEPEKPEAETPTYSSPASASEKEWLEPHNAARAEVGLPPLVWDDEVARFAENWANQRKASGCGLEHSGGDYGENIFWGSGSGYGPAECVAAWVREKEFYNYGDNSCSNGDCGHYTQIVWAKTTRLGCAKAECDDGSVFMTCNYDPPGNYIGTKPY